MQYTSEGDEKSSNKAAGGERTAAFDETIRTTIEQIANDRSDLKIKQVLLWNDDNN